MPPVKSALLTVTGLIALSCLACPLAASAYAPPPAAAAVKGSDAATPATDAGMARRQVLARQLTDLDGTRASTEHMTGQLMPLIKMALNGQAEIRALPQADQDKINELLAAEFDSYFFPQLIERYVDYYTANFSEAELQSLVTTFQSANMKKYAAVRVNSSTDMESVGAELGRESAMRAMAKYSEWKKTKTP